MNLLIDLITLSRKTGAGEYLRRVISCLLQEEHQDVHLFGLYDSEKGIAYTDLSLNMLKMKEIYTIDICGRSLPHIIEEFSIDRFFIGCAQYIGFYEGLEHIKCEVICVIHDLAYEEQAREDLDVYYRLKGKKTTSFINWLVFHRKKDQQKADLISPLINLSRYNPKTKIIAVSEFTKHSIMYTFGITEESITVLYSPERQYNKASAIQNEQLKKLIEDKNRFFLLLGAQHPSKNAQRAINAFQRFAESCPDNYLLTVGYNGNSQYKQHLVLPFLEEMDLQMAYQSCYALLYPSVFEGFGYPPLEAMHYSKPVLASNIGPIREVFQNAPCYFNPFSETDIFQTLCNFSKISYNALSQRSKAQYETIAKRQEKDLDKLISLILKH